MSTRLSEGKLSQLYAISVSPPRFRFSRWNGFGRDRDESTTRRSRRARVEPCTGLGARPCCAIPFILPFSYLGNIPNQVDLPPHPSEWRQLQRLVLQFSRKASIAGVTLFLEKCPDIPRLKDLVIEWGSWPRKRISCI